MARVRLLVLTNWKSYPGRHEIGPLSNLMSIIGPNGSGKSNIMDAIAFVLTVPTRVLRGKNLGDLVTMSVKDRAGVECSVELHVELSGDTHADAEEPEEVVVFRRSVTGLATSSFSVDGKTVGLNTYKAELERAGFPGSPRAYLVFQNSVADLSSRDPMTLTRLVEDVSGSGRLSGQYNDAQSKLDEALGQLRVQTARNRSAQEQKKKLKALAKEAKRYSELKARRESRRLKQFLLRLLSTTETIKSLDKQMAKGSGKLQSYEKRLKAAVKVEAEVRKAFVSIVKRLRKQENELEREKLVKGEGIAILRLETDVKLQRRKLMEAKEVRERMAAVVRSMGEERELLRRTRAELEDRVKELEEARQKQGETAAMPVELIPIKRLCDMKYREEAADKLKKIEATKSKVKEQNDELTFIKGLIGANTKSLTEVQSKISRARAKISELSTKVKSVEGKIKEQEEDKEKLADQHNTIQRQLDVTGKEIQQIENQLKEVKIGEAELKMIKREQEGLGKLKELFPGVFGFLEDMITITDKKYLAAISSSLGKHRRSVVVSNSHVAAECMNHLRLQRLTNFSFLPMNALRITNSGTGGEGDGYSSNMGKLFGSGETDVIRAADCVEYPQAIKPAIDFALGSIGIVGTPEAAKKLLWTNKRGQNGRDSTRKLPKLVTLDGVVFNSSGTVSAAPRASLMSPLAGGEGDTGGSKLTAREVVQLEGKLRALKERQDQQQKELSVTQEALANAEAGGAAMFRLRQTVSDMRKSLEEETRGLESYERQEGALTKTIKDIEAKSDSMTIGINSTIDSSGLIERELKELQEIVYKPLMEEVDKTQPRGTRRLSASEYLKRINDAESELNNSTRNKLSAVRADLAAIVARLEYLEGGSEDTSRGGDEEMGGATKQTTSAERRLEAANKQIRRIEEQLEEAKNKVKEANKANSNGSVITREGRIKALEGTSKTMREEMEENKKKLVDTAKEVRHLTKRVAFERKKRSVDEVKVQEQRVERAQLIERARVEGISIPTLNKNGGRDGEGNTNSQLGNMLLTASTLASQDSPEDVIKEFDTVLEEANIDFSVVKSEWAKINADGSTTTLQDVLTALARDDARISVELAEIEPNMKSIEMLNELSSKMAKDEEGLSAARKEVELRRAQFNEVSKERRTLFMECFDHLETHIDGIYRELTKSRLSPRGGSASISLTDPEMPFLGGITYSPMPPTESYRAIETLSGGERTISSLALIFTLSSFKRPPFCVLDEIDAALDAQNVRKVISFLKRRSAREQFLVISLKDIFFQESDALVGVTKGKDGASQIFTLDLTQFDTR